MIKVCCILKYCSFRHVLWSFCLNTSSQFSKWCRAQLSSRGEAFLHVALDLGMLGFTVAILWLCLKQYKPRALGWFRSRVWPPKWMLKVLLACAIGFPLAMYLGDFSQVWSQTIIAYIFQTLGGKAPQNSPQNSVSFVLSVSNTVYDLFDIKFSLRANLAHTWIVK